MGKVYCELIDPDLNAKILANRVRLLEKEPSLRKAVFYLSSGDPTARDYLFIEEGRERVVIELPPSIRPVNLARSP